MEIKPYIIYVKLDDQNRVIAINSSAFLYNIDGWTEIDSGYSDKYHHAQGNYFDKPIVDMRGIYRYKLVDGTPIERAQEEMDEEYYSKLTSTPTRLDIIEAQITYTAMMTDTLLEV